MTRIRYMKDTVDGVNLLVSKKDILLPNGELIAIVLAPGTNTYKFANVSNGATVSTGTAKNLLMLKKLVRETLLTLGVPLEVEVKKFKKNETTEVAA